MPDRQNPVFLSELAMAGYQILAAEFRFVDHRNISRMLKAFAEDDTLFADTRPEQYRAADKPNTPKIWNTGDYHKRRDLGALPFDYLTQLAQTHDIQPYKNQLRAMLGGLSKTPWRIRTIIGRHSLTAKVSPVIEAIGLHWLSPVQFPEISNATLVRRDRYLENLTRPKRVIIGG